MLRQSLVELVDPTGKGGQPGDLSHHLFELTCALGSSLLQRVDPFAHTHNRFCIFAAILVQPDQPILELLGSHRCIPRCCLALFLRHLSILFSSSNWPTRKLPVRPMGTEAAGICRTGRKALFPRPIGSARKEAVPERPRTVQS